LALNDIEHSRTKAKSPQTNGICERFQKTIKAGRRVRRQEGGCKL
jgi:transposase InsO family protein